MSPEPPDDPVRPLTIAARELAASPSDFPAWLMAAGHLAAAGRGDDAAHVFRRLGEAASAIGHVALAIACARWLGQRAHDAAALVDAIATTHAAGSAKVDAAARPAPPAPRQSVAQADMGTELAAPRQSVAQADMGTEVAAPRLPDADGPAPADLDGAARAALDAVDAAHRIVLDHAPARVPPTPLVHALGPAEVRDLIGVITLRAIPRATVIVDVGQPATALYWIAAGAVAVSRDGHRLGDLRAGAFFGEIALVGGTQRTARVTATEDALLLEIPAAAVEQAAARRPALGKVLALHARNRLLANVMRTSPLFTLLPEPDRAELLGAFETAIVREGASIVTRGAPNDHLWIVVSGRAEVRDADTVLAVIGPGDGVGEISLLRDAPATADVVALSPTALLRLSRDRFREVADRYPELLAELRRVADEREAANAMVVYDADALIV